MWHKRVFGGAVFLAAAGLIAGGAMGQELKKTGGSEPASTGKAKIEIKEKNFSFPKTQRGGKLTHAFKFRNSGTADLVIYDVKPGCGCTVAKYDELVRPGKEGRIVLTLDTNRLKGSFAKSATVKTNDPDMAEFRLQVAGQIISPFKISPRESIFLHTVEGEQASDRIFIGAEKQEGFEILNVSSSLNDYIDVELQDVIKGEKYMISVTTKPKAKAGVYNGKLLVETNNPESPRITVDVSVNVRGFVNVSPRLINFGRVERGKEANSRRTLKVELAHGSDLEILDVTTGSPYFEITRNTVDDGRVFTLNVTLKEIPPAEALSNGNEFEDKLIVHTNYEGYEEIDVELKLQVR